MSKKIKFMVVFMLLALISPMFVFAQSYTTYAASSNIRNQAYKKSDTVFVISNSGSFIWNRIMEEAIQAEFKSKGVTSFLLTDYMDITEVEDVDYEEIYNVITKTNAELVLEITTSDMYTYNLGEGIKKFDSNVNVFSCSDFNAVLRIGLTTEADTNDALSFAASRKPAIESTAKSLVEEYMKHIK